MTESEWKTLRTVKEAALERHCGRILDECQAVIQGSGSSHERYLRLYEVVENGDNQISWAFNDLRRSVADERLAFMVQLGLVTDEELGRFSGETRERTRLIVGLLR
ncbi:MAG TPA: hypothetical protein VFS20_04930 [Longimicrobium sp.]|nr:hypothetical protein [Longimicrobium sp.]